MDSGAEWATSLTCCCPMSSVEGWAVCLAAACRQCCFGAWPGYHCLFPSHFVCARTITFPGPGAGGSLGALPWEGRKLPCANAQGWREEEDQVQGPWYGASLQPTWLWLGLASAAMQCLQGAVLDLREGVASAVLWLPGPSRQPAIGRKECGTQLRKPSTGLCKGGQGP